MLQIKNPQFTGCYVDLKTLPEGKKGEIALVGRSNVGKSSLINRICKRKKLAKSSSTPGKTRTINYYDIDGAWNFVDLPGYGYAKVSKEEQNRWGKMIETYLRKREQLRGVILLVDIRHEPGKNDQQMKAWLEHCSIPILLVATKADKLSKSQCSRQLAVIRKALALPPGVEAIAFSAETGQGADEIMECMEEILQTEILPEEQAENPIQM